MANFDGFLILSFGGPEGPDDVMPFLDNVLKGKNVPLERKKEVARHYEMFGGVSPINDQNRELKDLLEKKFLRERIKLPIFWGNRNWKPYIKDALMEMKAAGIKRAIAYVTSAYSSYSGCRQYKEDIDRARHEIGKGAPMVEKMGPFFNHPKFIEANVQQIRKELVKIPNERLVKMHLIFTAHSIPVSMSSVSPYLSQLEETCSKVAAKLGIKNWELTFQSRSGPPNVPWLEPDLHHHLKELAGKGVKDVVISPIGFVSDHMEVKYDLDVEAKSIAEELGLHMLRASTPGNHSLMIDMIVDLVREKLAGKEAESCAANCCNIK